MFLKRRSFSYQFPPQFFAPIVDGLIVVFSSLLSYYLRFSEISLHDRYVLATAVITLLVIIFNNALGIYEKWRIPQIFSTVGNLTFVFFIVGVVVSSIIFFADASTRYSRLWVGLTLSISFLIIVSLRIALQYLLKKARLRGRARRSVFLIGPGVNLLEIARGMRASPGEGFSIAGVERIVNTLDEKCLDRIVRRVDSTNASEVWICVPLEMGSAVRKILYALRNNTSDVRFLPSFRDLHLLNHRITEVAGRASIDLSVTPMSGLSRIAKRTEDIFLGTIISICIVPLCIVIALLIKTTSTGPVLFKQYRTGSNGRRFKVYKFRTMEVHSETSGVITQAAKNDPRVTKLGRFLRRTSLDELPQFFNVLQGRMSIVGPRPHALEHNDYYKELVESYMRRHKVKPGITGWAQVNGFRGETDTIVKMESRVRYDLWYIDNWNIWLDLKIIFITIFKGFFGKNAY
ncbi:undecaprenyl-phosphate glucose phosphotransferase [Halomonas sp. H10-59]|uniref:Undecaprenyl-phosphate glucose phosphotransferase n=1 Tax=Halomonas sp. H10-59 TaxID=2950874 RepID=A0AAU7KZG7_9GAMM